MLATDQLIELEILAGEELKRLEEEERTAADSLAAVSPDQAICNALMVIGLIFPKSQLAFRALPMTSSPFYTNHTRRVLALTTA